MNREHLDALFSDKYYNMLWEALVLRGVKARDEGEDTKPYASLMTILRLARQDYLGE